MGCQTFYEDYLKFWGKITTAEELAEKNLAEIAGYGPPPNAKVITLGFGLPDAFLAIYHKEPSIQQQQMEAHLGSEAVCTQYVSSYSTVGGIHKRCATEAEQVIDSIAGDFLPGVSTYRSGYEIITGRNPDTGELLTAGEWGLAIVFLVPGLRAIKGARRGDEIVELINDPPNGTDEINFVYFNKTHKDSLPKPKGDGPNGGKLQSHHGLQQEWAKNNLSQYGYNSKLAPTITIETGKGLPHTIITNAQTARRNVRMASGVGKWNTTLQDELQFIVDDLTKASFSRNTTSQVLEQQYKMLDKLGVKYERVDY